MHERNFFTLVLKNLLFLFKIYFARVNFLQRMSFSEVILELYDYETVSKEDAYYNEHYEPEDFASCENF